MGARVDDFCEPSQRIWVRVSRIANPTYFFPLKGVRMSRNKPGVRSQITFLYYRDLQPASTFYQDVMGFELVEDQGWAKTYRVSGNAYLGVVDEEKGFHKAQEKSAVLVTLVVDDVFWWREHLESQGVKTLMSGRPVVRQ